MSVSTHVYSAALLDPTGDVVLGSVAGEVSLDASRVPHVEASLTVSVSDAMLLEQLDPRDDRRVRLDVSASFVGPGVTRARTFDLGIRSAVPNRAAGTVALRLASDELLLDDYAPLADDVTPRTLESSLRGVCGYVLGKIGAVLSPGVVDADVTAYWRVTNLLPNPSFEVNLNGWSLGTGAANLARSTGATPVTGSWTAKFDTTSAGSCYLDHADISVRPGTKITFAAYMVATAARPSRVMVRFKDAAGVAIRDVYSPAQTIAAFGWTRIALVGAVPPDGSVRASVHIEYQSDVPGRTVFIDAAMLYDGDELIAYGDGASPDDAHYTWEWSGAEHASVSTRTPVIEREPAALTWSAGVSGMEFLHPLLLASGLRLVCDEQRVWSLRSADYRADGAQTYRHAANITDAEEQLSRDDDAWYDAAVYVYRWSDEHGVEQERVDAFSLAPSPTKVLRREVKTPYPGPGRAEHVVRRAQGRGRTVTVSAVSGWDEYTDQLLSVLLEGTPIQTGIINRVVWNLNNDEVTVSSRTTDTPAAAWILVPDGERWRDSPVGESWTEEII